MYVIPTIIYWLLQQNKSASNCWKIFIKLDRPPKSIYTLNKKVDHLQHKLPLKILQSFKSLGLWKIYSKFNDTVISKYSLSINAKYELR